MEQGIQQQFQAAFDAFMTEAAEDAILESTAASWGGGGYSVELFGNGTYRVLWDNNIDSQSNGVIVAVPALGDEEYNPEDATLSYFDDALDELRETYSKIGDESP